MSGLDEQNIDYPRCPSCEDWKYWIAKEVKPYCEYLRGICFISNAMTEAHSHLTKVYIATDRYEGDLDNISNLVCNACEVAAPSAIFDQIIRIGKRYLRMSR